MFIVRASGRIEETEPDQFTPAAIAAKSEMLHGFAEILETGQGSDLTITCKGQTFRVHIPIVASRCHFFKSACWGGFKEAETRRIDLPDDHPEDVRAMIEYLYILNYTLKARSEFLQVLSDGSAPIDTRELRRLSSHQLLRNASLYGMGEKYGIHGLKGIASEKFADILGQPGRLEGMRIRSMIAVDGLITAVKCVYNTTPESDKGLRDQVLEYAGQHLQCLLPMEPFKAVLAEVPEFAYNLLVLKAGSKLPEEHVAKKRKKAGAMTISD